MAHSHQEKFNNPSRLFIWGYSIANLILGRSYYGKIIEELNLKGNESVLDFGCGLGFLSKRIANELRNGGNLTGLDVSEPVLKRTKRKLRKFKNINFILGDIRNSNLSENKFDYIVSSWVLHHIDPAELSETLEVLSKTLKPGGKIFVIEFPESDGNHGDFTEEELLNLFDSNTFSSRIIFSKNHGILLEFKKVN